MVVLYVVLFVVLVGFAWAFFLLGAEVVATGAKKGMHGKSDGSFRVMDLAGDALKSRQYLSFLKRAGTQKGIIMYVINGARFRVFVPSENCIITYALEGVRCPQGPRPARPEAYRGWTRGGRRAGGQNDDIGYYAKEGRSVVTRDR